MDEADPRIELREASDSLFDAGHADQHHAYTSLVEDGPDGFEAVHVQSIRFIHENQSRWISYRSLESLETFESLEIGRIDGRWITR